MDNDSNIQATKKCPKCAGPFIEQYILTKCKHIICKNCVSAKKDKKTGNLVCPFCKPESGLQHVKPLEPYDGSLSNQSKSGKRKKAMEPDLLQTAKEIGLNTKSYEESNSEYIIDTSPECSTQNQQSAHSVETPEAKVEDVESKMEELSVTEKPSGDKTTSDTIEKKTAKDSEKGKGEENGDIMTLFFSFFDIAPKCEFIQSFAPNQNRNKLVVDIADGQKEAVEQFLQDECATNFSAGRFEITEQNSSGHFLVGAGSKVANGDLQVIGEMLHQPSQQLRGQFGTVTCLAEDESGQLYVLTSCHVINQYDSNRPVNEEGLPGKGRFVSSYHNTLQEISSEYSAIFGPVTLEGKRYHVDIAAFKLTDSMQQKINDNACACRMQELLQIYEGSDDNLQDKMVGKNGAATGVTCGKIIRAMIGFKYVTTRRFGMGMLIMPQESDQPFAAEGDSGSLVWSRDGQPIGIVTYQNDKYQFGPSKVKATFVVRLDRCLQALHQKGFITNIETFKCKTHGSPIPVKKEDECPSSNMLASSVETQ